MNSAKAFRGILLLATALAALAALPACANDITQEWSSVKPPPVPQLKPATIEPRTTALLVLDFMKTNCGTRPRCGSTVPVANKLIAAARARHARVLHPGGREPEAGRHGRRHRAAA